LYDEITESKAFHEQEEQGINEIFNGAEYFVPIPQVDVWLNPFLQQEDTLTNKN